MGEPFRWLVKLYEFFALNNTPPHRMVSIASYYMERRSTGMVPRCGGIGFMHKLSAFHMHPTRSISSTNT